MQFLLPPAQGLSTAHSGGLMEDIALGGTSIWLGIIDFPARALAAVIFHMFPSAQPCTALLRPKLKPQALSNLIQGTCISYC